MTYTGLIVVTLAILLMWWIMHHIDKKLLKRLTQQHEPASGVQGRIGPLGIVSDLLAKALYRFLTSRPATKYIERLIYMQLIRTGIMEPVSGLKSDVKELYQHHRVVLVTIGCLLGLLSKVDVTERQAALDSLFEDWTERFNLRIETDKRIEELLVKLPQYEDIPKALLTSDFVRL